MPGRFRIDALIASGSFGSVYRARQLAVERDVAVKVVRAGVDPASEDGRLFLHEIQTVARIDHPHVVRVYQADVTEAGRLFFAMELLPGRDLQAILAEPPLDPERAVVLTKQLLAALDAVHRAGIVHADVKPGNALVTQRPDGERLVLVDFGFARLRQLDLPTMSVGGTPAFMAPEQLRAGRVDARSDQFSAALVLVILLTGWHRRSASQLVPPAEVLDTIADDRVRRALTRALALMPDDRFSSAAAFAAALEGDLAPPPARPPFHGLASFTEDDHGRLYGRERDLARITDLVLFRRLVILTAASGVGKTSLLRAGLVPRLGVLSTPAFYLSCRSDDESALSVLRAHDTATRDGAVQDGGRLHGILEGSGSSASGSAQPVVVLVDQVEAALETSEGASAGAAVLDAVLQLGARRRGGIHVVLGVREDFLARLLDRLPDRGDGAPIARIGPLDAEGARAAIIRPLAERQLAIEPALLDQLVSDLGVAGTKLGDELGWSVPSAVYPPHLQLACSVLHEQLPSGDTTMTVSHYRALGGFDAIVAQHLERVLDHLAPAEAVTARDVFLALVTSHQLRSARSEIELIDAAEPDNRSRVPDVLEILRRQGLIVRPRRPDGELVWELIHDSLVPRVLAWVDSRDLSRRRAIELVRHHLRRTRPGAPSLLSRAELRELADHASAIAALDAEWKRAQPDNGAPAWAPSALVARSRQIQRRSRLAAAALVLAVVAGITAAVVERWRAGSERRAERALRDGDLGLVTIDLTTYDWDVEQLRAVPVPMTELPHLSWSLHSPSLDDPDEPGEEFPASWLRRLASRVSPDRMVQTEAIEVRGGAAFLVVAGRGRSPSACLPSVLPLRALYGYARRSGGPQHLAIRIPSCQATDAGTVEVPAGGFRFGGLGDPPVAKPQDLEARLDERTLDLPGYRIDRTEVTNAAFAVLRDMEDATGIAGPPVIDTAALAHAGYPANPVSAVLWREARAYCRYLGKQLPSSAQWEKALRGGLELEGKDNPWPRRNFPWGNAPARAHQANLDGEVPPGVHAVGSFLEDRSPYGLVDMAGNVSEWLAAPTTTASFPRGVSAIRGGNWSDSSAADLLGFTPIEHARPSDSRLFNIGMRCVITGDAVR